LGYPTAMYRIEKLVSGGMGLARTDDGIALIYGGLPGELVEAKLEAKKNHFEGSATKVLEVHPGRVSGMPPAADLPLEYAAQLPIKQMFVQEALERIAKTSVNISPIQASPQTLHYRTASQYARHPLGGLAYRRPRTNELVQLTKDPLIAPPLQEAFDLLSQWPLSSLDEVVLRGSLYSGQVQVGFIGGQAQFFKQTAKALVQEGIAGVVWAETSPKGRFRGRVQHLAGEAALLEDFGILSTINVQSFAQVNPAAARLMYAEATQIIEGSNPGGVSGRALELYAGSGVLSLMVAPQFEQVVALEINRSAIKRGEADRERLGLSNVIFRQDDAKDLPLQSFDLVMLDPPRAGLTPEVRSRILQTAPERILYISCDPATWARDIKELSPAYKLTFVRPYDFYPFTHHVEILSVLERV
jgi:23S rRNA (uracil1939-C5)-methyltransferase